MKLEQQEKIVILGAGPTGLGAAYQLQKLKHHNWTLFEKASMPGGLASSVIDTQGFTWDLGGHVQFSHYKEFDEVMDSILINEWLFHDRSAWIWMRENFIPYPFQYNFHHLPKDEAEECRVGLSQNFNMGNQARKIDEYPFDEWIQLKFGKGIATSFMIPYNNKVWAYPLNVMGSKWIGERVAVLPNDVPSEATDHPTKSDWGPNNKFRFPLYGGTGAIWKALTSHLPIEKIKYKHEMVAINIEKQFITFRNGHTEIYDKLISSVPLDILIKNAALTKLEKIAKELIYSSTSIVGIGLKGKLEIHLQSKSWIYFPESNCPFYRITIFSNYSPNNVPRGEYWSILAEVASSEYKKVDDESIVNEVVRGLIETKILKDTSTIVSSWYHHLEYGYPTPTITRNECLNTLLPGLQNKNIFSRGRFGGWKYEVSNQDHSFMQGVECVNHILLDAQEITLNFPDKINSKP